MLLSCQTNFILVPARTIHPYFNMMINSIFIDLRLMVLIATNVNHGLLRCDAMLSCRWLPTFLQKLATTYKTTKQHCITFHITIDSLYQFSQKYRIVQKIYREHKIQISLRSMTSIQNNIFYMQHI